ncbi:S8 family serine peptidase [Ekhidna sp.]
MRIVFFGVLVLISVIVLSQTPSEENRNKLLRIASKHDSTFKYNQERIKEFLNSQNGKIQIPEGSSLVGFDKSGNPQYRIEHNRGASTATRTSDLYIGGTLAYNLTGKGMIAGVWENGSPNPSHQEFQGRLKIIDQASEERGHASHVTGTIIAAGVNPEAQGMAYEAVAHVFSADNDYSEIAIEASKGLLISNHSYGSSAGWTSSGNWIGDESISTSEDWKFGIYGPDAVAIDEIAFLAPYYLLIRSAGNENGESGDGTHPPDGPFDCITDEAIAKNVMTVANSNPLAAVPNGPDDVVIVASSSWGPADDGRIKPDLAAPGRNLLSAEIGANDSYDTKTGTSMSSPVVTGNSLLLQQLYHNLNAEYMKAATLKGLLLHTTLDVGESDGPDYVYGHGFLDANLAARVISENGNLAALEENQLSEGETFETTFEVTDSSRPLVVSISWTDPKGNLLDEVLDPTELNLVNDLDVRVIDGLGITFEPWILNPNSPGNAAKNGDNFRDNYEKVEIPNPETGTYTIRITHKNSLTNSKQDFSLIASNISRIDHIETYYRIGGGGNWDDPTKWSKSSGGLAANEMPTANSRVIVDEGSFPNAGNLILNENTSIGQLAWSTGKGKLVFNGNMLTMDRLTTVSQLSSSIGEIQLSTTSDKTLFAEFEASNPTLTLIVDKENGQMNLKGQDLMLNEIVLESGTLKVFDNLESDLNLSSSNTKELILDSIEITTSNLIMGNSANTSLSAKGTAFTFQGKDELHLISSDNTFDLERATLGDGRLSISQNGHITSLSINDDTELLLAENISLEVDELKVSASADNGVKFSAYAGAASLLSDSEDKFCLDYVEVDGVNVSGTSKFVLDETSTLTSGEGWISARCEDVLFANFSLRSPCADASTFFTDESDGQPTSWIWDFGDGTTSSDQNPIHEYDETGTYMVSLTVEVNGESNSRVEGVIIIKSEVVRPVIELTSNRLITNTPGEVFQWYLDGVILEGETSRLLSQSPQKGLYQVEITDNSCSVISDPFVVLSALDKTKVIEVYPNPATDVLYIKSFNQTKNVKISMFDFSGRRIRQITREFSGESEFELPVKDLPKGMYFITITDDSSESQSVRVIIQ